MADTIESAEEQKAARPKATGKGVRIRIIGAIAIVIAIVLAFYAFATAGYVADAKAAADENEARYKDCSAAIDDLQDASDYLTDQARLFVVTGRRSCMDAYLEELTTTNRRGNAVNQLKESFSDDLAATTELLQALLASDELAKTELVAMNLAAEHYGFEDVPQQVAEADVSEYADLGKSAKLDAAKDLMLGEDYERAKDKISQSVKAASDALLDELTAEETENDAVMQSLLFQQRIAVALLLCVVMILVLVLLMYVLKPLSRYIKRIEANDPLEPDGSFELHYLANAYNNMYEDNNQRIEQLRQYAERDPLTGISNRSGYDNFLATHTRNIALLLIDIDNFRDFNHVYGRDTGDAVMKKLAQALSTAFRSTDFPCRIDSDKFAVIMTNMSADLHDAVSGKIELVNHLLADDADDLPLITISVGAAFSTEGMTDQEIYEAAEKALEHVQENGSNGLAFYGEFNEAE